MSMSVDSYGPRTFIESFTSKYCPKNSRDVTFPIQRDGMYKREGFKIVETRAGYTVTFMGLIGRFSGSWEAARWIEKRYIEKYGREE